MDNFGKAGDENLFDKGHALTTRRAEKVKE
jgi:hypothetical protein